MEYVVITLTFHSVYFLKSMIEGWIIRLIKQLKMTLLIHKSDHQEKHPQEPIVNRKDFEGCYINYLHLLRGRLPKPIMRMRVLRVQSRRI